MKYSVFGIRMANLVVGLCICIYDDVFGNLRWCFENLGFCILDGVVGNWDLWCIWCNCCYVLSGIVVAYFSLKMSGLVLEIGFEYDKAILSACFHFNNIIQSSKLPSENGGYLTFSKIDENEFQSISVSVSRN